MPQQPWRPHYDLLPGFIVFLVAIPLCLGIALASGAPPETGLIAGIVGGLVVASISGSRTSVSGPAAGLATIVAEQIHALGLETFFAAVLLAGVLQILMGVFRAGFLSSFFPSAVIKGLLAAIGVLLILKQIPHLFGVDKDYEGEMSFWQADQENTFSELLNIFSQIEPGALIIGTISLLLLVFWNRIPGLTRFKVIAPLIVVLIGFGLVYAFEWWIPRFAIGASHLIAVPVAETMDAFVKNIRFPDFSSFQHRPVYFGAITIALIASLETLLNVEAVDKLDPEKRVTPPNRELIAQGTGNLICGLIGGLPVTSVIVRSKVNLESGGRSKMSAIIHGLLLAVSFYFFPTILNRIPLATLAAVLIVTGFKLADAKLFRQMWSEGWNQFLPFVATILAIVFTDLLVGVLIGLGISFAFILYSNFQNPMKRILEKHIGGDVMRIELANQVSFLNRAALKRELYALPKGSQVLIDARNTEYIDADVLDLITEFRDEAAKPKNIKMSFVGFRDHYGRVRNEIRYVDYSNREVQERMTPDTVLQILKEGNERFRTGKSLTRDYGRQIDATKSGQFPLAVVLSCIDSRTPAEIVFDLGLGDIFSVRVAGNIAKEKVLGSMEFGCAVAGAKLIFVMGHTRCGAVTKAVELLASGSSAAAELDCTHIDVLLREIQKAASDMQVTSQLLAEASRKSSIVDDVAVRNVRRMMRLIEEQSPKLSEMKRKGEIDIVGGLYDVETGSMEYLEADS